ncbi:MAG TPA: type IV pilus secretin PilQ [Nitrospiraceae bacterium]|nr:type IV pilus secretin PilQ [Nitrospiraceae bacterium]
MKPLYTAVGQFVLILVLLSCAHQSAAPVDQETDQKLIPLEGVKVTDLGDRVRVQVESDRVLAYDLSTSTVPASVTVDLPGFSQGKGLQQMAINKPPILRMTPTEVTSPRAGVQLVFSLATAVEPDVLVDGTRLFIDFPKVAVEASGSEQATSGGPLAGNGQSSPVEQRVGAGTPARTMIKVEVERGEGEAIVVIHGDGTFTYDVRPLNHDRLVVDLAHVSSPLRLPVLSVDHPLLKQIRVGHHPDKIRLVLDLPRQSTYSVRPGSNSLVVRLTPASDPGALSGMGNGSSKRLEPRDADRQGMDQSSSSQDEGHVRIAPAGRVPFPERLARIEAAPRLGQMAPEAKGTAEQPEEIGQARYVGRKISLDFQGADITNVLRLIADVSGFNIVVGEGVKAKVTLKLVSVPWDQALDMLLRMNNLGMLREGNIVWIDTLANIARQQEEEAKAKESKIKAEDLVTKVIYVQNVPAVEIQTTLKQYLSTRGQINLNTASNALVVQDTESRIATFTQLVKELDLEVPQIQIEARIVQADTTYERSLGIQWGYQSLTNMPNGNVSNFRGQAGSSDAFGAQTGNFLINLPAAVAGLTAIPTAGFTYGKAAEGTLLDLRLSAGERLGLTKVIAAPKITTLDKREAKIEQGSAVPFQTTSLQGTQTTFVDALLSLTVTPQITSRDPKELSKQILLKIKATRNAPDFTQSTAAGPSISKKEAITQVLVRDGETLVIGGVFIDDQSNRVSGVPFLSRIPILGWLFKNKTETVTKNELLIFLTPTIIKS